MSVTNTVSLLIRELLDGLRKAGFGLTMGEDDSGFLILALMRLGGYYLGTSAVTLFYMFMSF